MGTAKSLANMYSYNEYLYFYINKKDEKKVQEILNLRPNLIKDPLTLHSKVTALNQAVFNNNQSMVQLLLTKYEADINLPSPRGETPLITAIKRNHIRMAKYLVEHGADPNFVDKSGLSTLDYAILQGLYEISYYLYPKIKDRELKSAAEFKDIGKQFHYRYVNYQIFLRDLQEMVHPEKVSDFLTKKRNILSDPVIDPNETWKQWFKRNLQFQDPPLVERSSLPEELRPQNRRFGKFGNFLSRMTMTPASQKPQYLPAAQSQMLQNTSNKLSRMTGQKLQIQSIS